jgi:hypothetical protein
MKKWAVKHAHSTTFISILQSKLIQAVSKLQIDLNKSEICEVSGKIRQFKLDSNIEACFHGAKAGKILVDAAWSPVVECMRQLAARTLIMGHGMVREQSLQGEERL